MKLLASLPLQTYFCTMQKSSCQVFGRGRHLNTPKDNRMKLTRMLFTALMASLLIIPVKPLLADDPPPNTPPPPPGPNTMSIKVFLQGLYDTGTGEMRKAQDWVDGQAVDAWIGTQADRIIIQIHKKGFYGVEGHIWEVNPVVLNQDGMAAVNVGFTGGEYYITIVHRNHVRIASKEPIDMATVFAEEGKFVYDFTTSADQAYGDNQVDLGEGVYGMYFGDVDQDGDVTIIDRTDVISALRTGVRGYVSEDLDGDGDITIIDRTLVIQALRAGRIAVLPEPID